MREFRFEKSLVKKTRGADHFWFMHSFMHSFIHAFIHSFLHSFMHPFIHPSIHCHSVIHAFIHSFIHGFIHSFIHSFLPSFLHSFIRSFIHSFIHVNYFVLILSFQLIDFNSFVFQLIYFSSLSLCISFHFSSLLSNSPRIPISKLVPIAMSYFAGHYLVMIVFVRP